MKILRVETLIDNGSFSSSMEYKKIEDDVISAIKSIENPVDAGKFIIYPIKNANGVVPIKNNFIKTLNDLGWIDEKAEKDPVFKNKKIDITYKISNKNARFGVEWETGNISSSHRAINRLLLGIFDGSLQGGILVVPSREFYYYLTDRIGNFQELIPYFELWKLYSKSLSNCILKIIEIEHDETSESILPIPKGKDGRARK